MGPRGASAPMTRRVQLFPPSNDTPSNRPLGTSGRVDMVTMFEGSVGLMAIASSASLPCKTLASKFAGGGGAAEADGAIIAASRDAAAKAGAETVRIRAMRHWIGASRHRGTRGKTQQRYGCAMATAIAVHIPACLSGERAALRAQETASQLIHLAVVGQRWLGDAAHPDRV